MSANKNIIWKHYKDRTTVSGGQNPVGSLTLIEKLLIKTNSFISIVNITEEEAME